VAFIAWLCIVWIALVFLRSDHTCRLGFESLIVYHSMNDGPCHHGMARPQVADGGTASYMEGSCE